MSRCKCKSVADFDVLTKDYNLHFYNKCVDTVWVYQWVFILFFCLGAGPEALRPSRLHVKASVRDDTTFPQSS